MVRVPAVKVGHHGYRGIAKLRFARQFGFRHIGHSNHITVPSSVELRLCQARKLRAFHDEVSAAIDDADARVFTGLQKVFAESSANGVCHRNMRNQPGSKKAFLSGEGAVDKLVD